jgi:hypothetical protein
MLFLQSHNIVELYCWVDTLLPSQTAPREGRPLLFSDSETITLLIWCTVVSKHKTLVDIYNALYVYHQKDFTHIPSYKTFVRRAHHCAPLFLHLLIQLLSEKEAVRIMDSTMLPVCKLQRADHHKVAKNIARFGKNWQGWHYGFKLHASVSLDGRLCAVAFTPANVYDAQAMPKILNAHCRVAVGDTLYGARTMGERIKREYGTIIIATPHPKQKRKITAPWQIALLNQRSKIECVFDYLKEHLHLVTSFPRSISGYVLHYLRILLSYQIMALRQG